MAVSGPGGSAPVGAYAMFHDLTTYSVYVAGGYNTVPCFDTVCLSNTNSSTDTDVWFASYSSSGTDRICATVAYLVSSGDVEKDWSLKDPVGNQIVTAMAVEGSFAYLAGTFDHGST